MTQHDFLLYGANGYTGQLIARYAADYGLKPLLAGRNGKALKEMSQRLTLDYRVVDLNNVQELTSLARQCKLVVHAAGPFQHTADQMITACLKTGTHYVDINGDINVFEKIKQYDQRAQEANIMLLPGAGFDVVPTDCTALYLKNLLPDAVFLKLAFVSEGGALSHGTATTMINKLGEGGLLRKDGKIIKASLGEHGRWLTFHEKKRFVMSIPWGDVSTAYTSTGIRNIETFAGISPAAFYFLKLQGLYNWLLRKESVRNIFHSRIKNRPAGPSDEMRKNAQTYIWGEVENPSGKKATSTLQTPDGYSVTMHGVLIIAKKILAGNVKPGYQTPAGAYGDKLVFEIPGVKRMGDAIS